MRCRPIAAAVVAFLLWAPLTGAQRQVTPPSSDSRRAMFELRGWVRFADIGAPAEMVRVDLYAAEGRAVASVHTDSSGRFEFLGVGEGTYVLVIEVEGYERLRETVELFRGRRPHTVQLFLARPVTPTPASPGGDSVDVRELRVPRAARDAFERGLERLKRRRDPKSSIPLFQRALREFPGYYEAQHALGIALLELSKTAEAEQAFRAALELSEGRDAPAYVSLAALQNDARKFAEAARLARQALQLAPDVWEAHFELARALFNQDLIPQAEASLGEAQRRKPDFAQIYLLYADLCIRKQDLDGLLVSLEEYLRLDPDGAHAEYARGMLERAREQKRKSGDSAGPKN